MKLVLFFGFFMLNNSAYTQDKMVELNTTMGKMVIKLYNETPEHRDNFLKLTRQGYFDKQLFHRVIDNFMIQSGDPNSIDADKGEMLGTGGPDYTLPAKFVQGIYHKKGALAAARKEDAVNPEKRSSGSQFYIVQGRILTPGQLEALVRTGRHKPFTEKQIEDYTTIGGAPHLDGDYTVFGELVEGFDVLDSIASVPVDAYNRPVEDVIILEAKVLQ